jgi:hypothetical protein
MIMKIRPIGIAGVTAALIALGVAAAPAQASFSPSHGCPSGAVCLYSSEYEWSAGYPKHAFSRYGYHPLHNEYGKNFVIFNNQYSWSAGNLTFYPGAYACKAATASACPINVPMDRVEHRVNIDPINYIRVTSGA